MFDLQIILWLVAVVCVGTLLTMLYMSLRRLRISITQDIRYLQQRVTNIERSNQQPTEICDISALRDILQANTTLPEKIGEKIPDRLDEPVVNNIESGAPREKRTIKVMYDWSSARLIGPRATTTKNCIRCRIRIGPGYSRIYLRSNIGIPCRVTMCTSCFKKLSTPRAARILRKLDP